MKKPRSGTYERKQKKRRVLFAGRLPKIQKQREVTAARHREAHRRRLDEVNLHEQSAG